MDKIVHRLTHALWTLPTPRDWLWTIGLLLAYGAIYLPIGLSQHFLQWQPQLSLWTVIGVTVKAFVMPGIVEELVFRGLLIPRATEPVTPIQRRVWIGVSWVSFVLYHPLNRFGPEFFADPIFLIGAGLLGILCTIVYLKSGSLWTSVVAHWLSVVGWLLLWGGLAKFQAA